MFTKLILLLSVSKASPPSNCYKSTIQCLKNMFSNLGSVVVSANILLDNETNITVDILTRMMTTICYHSPHLLKSIVTGQIRVILFQKVFIQRSCNFPFVALLPNQFLVCREFCLGLSPYTTSENIAESIRTICITIFAVILTEKADNNSEIISQIVENLLSCLENTKK